MGESVWTWRGKYFGYIDGDQLRTYQGLHVGKVNDDLEIYGKDGKYLGEIRNENRLITRRNKLRKTKTRFIPRMKRVKRVKRVNKVGRVMVAGYEDFPEPDSFN